MLESKQSFDPRSPVQLGRDPTPMLVFAFFVAVLALFVINAWPASLSVQRVQGLLRSRMEIERKSSNLQSRHLGTVGLFTGDDYPPDAADRNEQGTTQVRLRIDTTGRPEWCTIIKSSGSLSLDRATCRIFESRARFNPARDSSGKLVTGAYVQSVTWRLEE